MTSLRPLAEALALEEAKKLIAERDAYKLVLQDIASGGDWDQSIGQIREKKFSLTSQMIEARNERAT